MQQDPILQGEDGLERSSEKESTKDKRQSRINALVFGLVFLLVAIAPYPWNSYAPLLFLLPLIYSILNKLKQKSGAEEGVQDSQLTGSRESNTRRQPYSQRPRDPKDPRKYRPIN
jgi:hypothetical protein